MASTTLAVDLVGKQLRGKLGLLTKVAYSASVRSWLPITTSIVMSKLLPPRRTSPVDTTKSGAHEITSAAPKSGSKPTSRHCPMGVLAAMLIVANAAAAVRADEWSEAHTQCYTDAMTLQTLSIAYLSGKTRVQAIETLGASRIPALVQKIDRVYADKPANYEEYGARIFSIVHGTEAWWWTRGARKPVLRNPFWWRRL